MNVIIVTKSDLGCDNVVAVYEYGSISNADLLKNYPEDRYYYCQSHQVLTKIERD